MELVVAVAQDLPQGKHFDRVVQQLFHGQQRLSFLRFLFLIQSMNSVDWAGNSFCLFIPGDFRWSDTAQSGGGRWRGRIS